MCHSHICWLKVQHLELGQRLGAIQVSNHVVRAPQLLQRLGHRLQVVQPLQVVPPHGQNLQVVQTVEVRDLPDGVGRQGEVPAPPGGQSPRLCRGRTAELWGCECPPSTSPPENNLLACLQSRQGSVHLVDRRDHPEELDLSPEAPPGAPTSVAPPHGSLPACSSWSSSPASGAGAGGAGQAGRGGAGWGAHLLGLVGADLLPGLELLDGVLDARAGRHGHPASARAALASWRSFFSLQRLSIEKGYCTQYRTGMTGAGREGRGRQHCPRTSTSLPFAKTFSQRGDWFTRFGTPWNPLSRERERGSNLTGSCGATHRKFLPWLIFSVM